MAPQHRLLRIIVVLLLLLPALLGAALGSPVTGVRFVAAEEEAPTATEPSEPAVEPTATEDPAAETPTPVPTEPPVSPEPTASPTEPPVTAEPTPPTETPAPTETPTPDPSAMPVPTEQPVPTASPDATTTATVGPAAIPTPRLAIAKNAGHVAEMLGVSITGFPAATRVAIYFDGARKLTLTTNDAGAASGAIRVPAAAAGLHEIKAKGGGKIALRNFRIRPVFKLSTSTVTAGGQVTATLTGFAASSATRIRIYDTNDKKVSVWPLTTDVNGGARQTFTTYRSLKAGKYEVVATDALGNKLSTYLTITAYRPEPPEPDDPTVSQLYYRGTSGRREVALTFDLDADRGYAEYVLDVLAANGVKATFGVAGYWASANPDLIRRMVAEGHQIINHSMTHPSFTGAVAGEVAVLSRDARLGELWAQEAVISRITGGYVQEPYWRPPYGDFNTSVLIDVAAGGYTATIMWTCDTMGWYGATAAQIINTCGYGAVAGDIILMHPSSRSMDGPALPDLIAVLRSRGFAFATVERILQ